MILLRGAGKATLEKRQVVNDQGMKEYKPLLDGSTIHIPWSSIRAEADYSWNHLSVYFLSLLLFSSFLIVFPLECILSVNLFHAYSTFYIHTNISGSDFRKRNSRNTHWKSSGVWQETAAFYVEGDYWAKKIKLYMAYKCVKWS